MTAVPFWVSLTTWLTVNAVALLQTIGFATRRAHAMTVNHTLGKFIAVMALPAAIAGVGYARAGSWWWIGPALFVAFVALMSVVDYLRPVEFRHPARPAILAPYLILFFGSLAVMGASMYEVNRGLWAVTAATCAALLVSMTIAIRQGNG